MADTGKPEDGPSLEMPALSLRRKKKTPAEAPPEAPPEPTVEVEREPEASDEAVAEAPPITVPEPEPLPVPKALRERRTFSAPKIPLPALAGIPAAAVTGVVVGGLAVLFTWLAISGCDAVRGTKSCGGGPGILILVAVLIVLAYTGGWLLRSFDVPDANSTSFLAVGVLAVVVMLFLLDALYDWWMVIAIPVVAVIAYIVSWWVTTAIVESDDAPETTARR